MVVLKWGKIFSTRCPFLPWTNNQTHVPPSGGSNVDPLSMMNANTLWFTFHCRYVRMSFFYTKLGELLDWWIKLRQGGRVWDPAPRRSRPDQNKSNNGWGKTELHLGYFCPDFPWQCLLEDIISGWKWTVWSSVPPLWAPLVGLDAPRQRLPIIDKVPCLCLVPYACSDSRPWYLSSSSALSLSHCSRTLYLISHVGGICRWGLPI